VVAVVTRSPPDRVPCRSRLDSPCPRSVGRVRAATGHLRGSFLPVTGRPTSPRRAVLHDAACPADRQQRGSAHPLSGRQSSIGLAHDERAPPAPRGGVGGILARCRPAGERPFPSALSWLAQGSPQVCTRRDVRLGRPRCASPSRARPDRHNRRHASGVSCVRPLPPPGISRIRMAPHPGRPPKDECPSPPSSPESRKDGDRGR
jgi:hypothetical protein